MRIAWESPPYGVDVLEANAADGYKTTLSPLRRNGEVRCCIRGCGTWLPQRTRKAKPSFCPEHRIGISTRPAYLYQDWRRNILLQRDLMAKVKEHKFETWRLGNESSEDAVSWNVFVGLAYLNGLREAFEVLTGILPRAEPQLFFWGVEIWPTYRPGVWPKLSKLQHEMEPGFPIQTEPDIILRVPGQALVLVEAKFGSPNSTLDKKPDVELSDFIRRYCSPPARLDPLNRTVLPGMHRTEVLEQLCRNAIFSNCLAEDNEQAFVGNLVRDCDETDVKVRMDKHLCPDARPTFRRITWEMLSQLPAVRTAKAYPLYHYLKTKTFRLRPAFTNIS